MRQKTIGILTFHSVTNYGAFMQCCGLYRACSALRPGVRIEVINYQPYRAAANYLRNGFLRAKNPGYLVKMARFAAAGARAFRTSGSPIFRKEGLARLADRYDTVLTGSDEVWRLGGLRGHDLSYFLDFCGEGTRRVAYAPSASGKAKPSDYSGKAARLLSAFSAVSVRDATTRDLIAPLVDLPVVETLDPTFLSDFDDLAVPGRPVDGRYVLLYGEPPPGDVPAIRGYALDRGCRLVSVNRRLPYADLSFPNAGPELWLALYRDAEAVVTEFYHGLIFALKNRKPFVMYRNPGKAAKVDGLAEKLGFSELLVQTPLTQVDLEGRLASIPYGAIIQGLDGLRAESMRFLDEALA